MFECYARKKPWDGFTNAAAVHKVGGKARCVFVTRRAQVLSQQRMAPPKDAPPIVAELMRLCWQV
jgi:hypothetical protein